MEKLEKLETISRDNLGKIITVSSSDDNEDKNLDKNIHLENENVDQLHSESSNDRWSKYRILQCKAPLNENNDNDIDNCNKNGNCFNNNIFDSGSNVNLPKQNFSSTPLNICNNFDSDDQNILQFCQTNYTNSSNDDEKKHNSQERFSFRRWKQRIQSTINKAKNDETDDQNTDNNSQGTTVFQEAFPSVQSIDFRTNDNNINDNNGSDEIFLTPSIAQSSKHQSTPQMQKKQSRLSMHLPRPSFRHSLTPRRHHSHSSSNSVNDYDESHVSHSPPPRINSRSKITRRMTHTPTIYHFHDDDDTENNVRGHHRDTNNNGDDENDNLNEHDFWNQISDGNEFGSVGLIRRYVDRASPDFMERTQSQSLWNAFGLCDESPFFLDSGVHVDALPTRTLQEKEMQSWSEALSTCTICHDKFKDGDSVKTLPCFHFFHIHEIDEWLKRSRVCPVCRHPIDELNVDDKKN